MSNINKEKIKEIRESMIDQGIWLCDTGWFEYKGKMCNLKLEIRQEELDK